MEASRKLPGIPAPHGKWSGYFGLLLICLGIGSSGQVGKSSFEEILQSNSGCDSKPKA